MTLMYNRTVLGERQRSVSAVHPTEDFSESLRGS